MHNGALVKVGHTYAAHKGANVDGSRAVIRLAATGRPKVVHYVSSLSVFSAPESELSYSSP